MSHDFLLLVLISFGAIIFAIMVNLLFWIIARGLREIVLLLTVFFLFDIWFDCLLRVFNGIGWVYDSRFFIGFNCIARLFGIKRTINIMIAYVSHCCFFRIFCFLQKWIINLFLIRIFFLEIQLSCNVQLRWPFELIKQREGSPISSLQLIFQVLDIIQLCVQLSLKRIALLTFPSAIQAKWVFAIQLQVLFLQLLYLRLEIDDLSIECHDLCFLLEH